MRQLEYDLVERLQGHELLWGEDERLLAAWGRWQADPDRLLPPGYLHGAFAAWIETWRRIYGAL